MDHPGFAIGHHLLAFALLAILAAETAIVAPGLAGAWLGRLQQLDPLYWLCRGCF